MVAWVQSHKNAGTLKSEVFEAEGCHSSTGRFEVLRIVVQATFEARAVGIDHRLSIARTRTG